MAGTRVLNGGGGVVGGRHTLQACRNVAGLWGALCQARVVVVGLLLALSRDQRGHPQLCPRPVPTQPTEKQWLAKGDL